MARFIWWSKIKIEGSQLTYRLAPRKPTGLKPHSEAKWKASSERYLRHIQTAYEQQLPIAAVIVDGRQLDVATNPNASKVDARELDKIPWAVARFNPDKREGLLVRGTVPVLPEKRSVDVELSAFEGWRRRAFDLAQVSGSRVPACQNRRSDKREWWKASLAKCRGAGLNFGERYGALGQGYAHVHHRVPLSKSPEGRMVTLKDLAVVCANCHAMIHLGGQCRELENIIPK